MSGRKEIRVLVCLSVTFELNVSAEIQTRQEVLVVVPGWTSDSRWTSGGIHDFVAGREVQVPDKGIDFVRWKDPVSRSDTISGPSV
jgi:hypothetical protein